PPSGAESGRHVTGPAAGYTELLTLPSIARRKFVDVHRAQGSTIADEAIRRIAQPYAAEKETRGPPPDRRVEVRQAKARPVFDD
ncbi:transposase, partial [uncultured Jannaschia sp.]|uniref:IS66 family transposase n=1 Tax=uncultured Jannaschia sp. TaxID=293347 RepID=UPI002605A153